MLPRLWILYLVQKWEMFKLFRKLSLPFWPILIHFLLLAWHLLRFHACGEKPLIASLVQDSRLWGDRSAEGSLGRETTNNFSLKSYLFCFPFHFFVFSRRRPFVCFYSIREPWTCSCLICRSVVGELQEFSREMWNLLLIAFYLTSEIYEQASVEQVDIMLSYFQMSNTTGIIISFPEMRFFSFDVACKKSQAM